MEIEILHFVEGARKAKGITVIIDVFRAFSLAAYAFSRNAEKIIPVSSLDTAFGLKKKNPDYILIGERQEQKIPGFDFGNSPTHIHDKDFTGKTIVHSTSAGTQGLVNTLNADQILTGSFVNAGATIEYIRSHEPKQVTLVCMGYAAMRKVEEDSFCAEYIKNELEGRHSDTDEMFRIIRQTSGKRFFMEDKQAFAPSMDFELCIALNRFNFAIKAQIEKGFHVLHKLEID